MDNSIDGEINLLPYLVAVVRRWYWIVLAALIGGGVAGALAMSSPASYEASASILFVGDRAQLRLDPRLVMDDNAISDSVTRRLALMELATSPIIEQYLPEEVVQQLAPKGMRTGQLARALSVSQMGDLLWITARSGSAEEAQLLATAWARAYVGYINGVVFGLDSSAIPATEAQVEDARVTYQAAQQRYLDFLMTNRLDEVNNQINSLFSLLDGNQRANTALYQYQIARAQTLEQIMQDAEALRDQLATGQSIAPGESLAVLLLRVRAVGPTTTQVIDRGGENPPPITAPQSLMQLTISETELSGLSQEAVQDELDRLIASLEQQIETMQANIAEAEEALANNQPTAQSSLTPEQQERYYQRMIELRHERERLSGQENAFLQGRDVALEKLEVVERKLAEQQVIATQSGAEVRFASEALQPAGAVRRGTALRVLVGGVAGALFGTLLALLAAFQLPAALVRRPGVPSRAADRPSVGT